MSGEAPHPILTARLELRRPKRGDGRSLEAVFDATVVDAMGWTARDRAEMIDFVCRRRSRPFVLLICEQPHGDVIGVVSLAASSGRPAIGIILGPTGRGRGLGGEALAAALPYFATRHPQVVIETAETNIAMRRLAEATGLVQESRYSHLLPNGARVPAVRYIQAPSQPAD